MFELLQHFNDTLADNFTLFRYDSSGSAVGTSLKVWMFGKNDFDRTSFIKFVYNVVWYCVKKYKIK